MNGIRICLSVIVCATILSTQTTAQWEQTSGPSTEVTITLAVQDSTIYAGTYQGGIFASTNYGGFWKQIDGGSRMTGDTGFTARPIRALALLEDRDEGPTLLAGTDGAGLFRSANADSLWEPANYGLRGTTIRALLARESGDSSSRVFVATDSGLFVSMNYGTSWSSVPLGGATPSSYAMVADREDPNRLFVVTSSGAYHSSDGGSSWIHHEISLFPSVVIGSVFLRAANDGTMFRSTDHGQSWTEGDGVPGYVHLTSFAVGGTRIFGGSNEGVWYSLDSGLTWSYSNGPEWGVKALAVCGPYLIAAVEHAFITSGSVCRRQLSEMTTGVPRAAVAEPEECRLEQNYPNPFNPSTSIRYSVLTNGGVSLSIFNTLGQRLREIVQGFQVEGEQVVEWDGRDERGSAVPSGVYYCVLRVVAVGGEPRQQVRSMMLLR